MKKKLCTAAIQFNITLGDIDSNLEKAVGALKRVAKQGVQLAVRPEIYGTLPGGRRGRRTNSAKAEAQNRRCKK